MASTAAVGSWTAGAAGQPPLSDEQLQAEIERRLQALGPLTAADIELEIQELDDVEERALYSSVFGLETRLSSTVKEAAPSERASAAPAAATTSLGAALGTPTELIMSDTEVEAATAASRHAIARLDDAAAELAAFKASMDSLVGQCTGRIPPLPTLPDELPPDEDASYVDGAATVASEPTAAGDLGNGGDVEERLSTKSTLIPTVRVPTPDAASSSTVPSESEEELAARKQLVEARWREERDELLRRQSERRAAREQQLASAAAEISTRQQLLQDELKLRLATVERAAQRAAAERERVQQQRREMETAWVSRMENYRRQQTARVEALERKAQAIEADRVRRLQQLAARRDLQQQQLADERARQEAQRRAELEAQRRAEEAARRLEEENWRREYEERQRLEAERRRREAEEEQRREQEERRRLAEEAAARAEIERRLREEEQRLAALEAERARHDEEQRQRRLDEQAVQDELERRARLERLGADLVTAYRSPAAAAVGTRDTALAAPDAKRHDDEPVSDVDAAEDEVHGSFAVPEAFLAPPPPAGDDAAPLDANDADEETARTSAAAADKEGTERISEDMLQMAAVSLGGDYSALAKLELHLENLCEISGLERVPNLLTLSLNVNRIRRIERLEPCGRRLLELSLKDNALRGAPGPGLAGAPLLRWLCLDVNRLNSLEGLEHCPQLASLSVVSNRLKSLRGLEHCQHLRTLRAASNKLRHFDAAGPLRACLPTLQLLDLGYNQIDQLGETPLRAPLLQTLVLHRNRLTRWGVLFGPLLRELWLNNNQLATLDLRGSWLPQLEVLAVQDNQLSTLHSLRHCRLLKSFNVSFNQITDASQLTSALAGLERLEVVQANDNPLPESTYRPLLVRLLSAVREIDGRPVESHEQSPRRLFGLQAATLVPQALQDGRCWHVLPHVNVLASSRPTATPVGGKQSSAESAADRAVELLCVQQVRQRKELAVQGRRLERQMGAAGDSDPGGGHEALVAARLAHEARELSMARQHLSQLLAGPGSVPMLERWMPLEAYGQQAAQVARLRAACSIQACWRRYVRRRGLLLPAGRRAVAAAVRLQSWWRGELSRAVTRPQLHAWRARRDAAATRIQAVWRGRRVFRRFRDVREALRAEMRALDEEDEELKLATTLPITKSAASPGGAPSISSTIVDSSADGGGGGLLERLLVTDLDELESEIELFTETYESAFSWKTMWSVYEAEQEATAAKPPPAVAAPATESISPSPSPSQSAPASSSSTGVGQSTTLSTVSRPVASAADSVAMPPPPAPSTVAAARPNGSAQGRRPAAASPAPAIPAPAAPLRPSPPPAKPLPPSAADLASLTMEMNDPSMQAVLQASKQNRAHGRHGHGRASIPSATLGGAGSQPRSSSMSGTSTYPAAMAPSAPHYAGPSYAYASPPPPQLKPLDAFGAVPGGAAHSMSSSKSDGVSEFGRKRSSSAHIPAAGGGSVTTMSTTLMSPMGPPSRSMDDRMTLPGAIMSPGSTPPPKKASSEGAGTSVRRGHMLQGAMTIQPSRSPAQTTPHRLPSLPSSPVASASSLSASGGASGNPFLRGTATASWLDGTSVEPLRPQASPASASSLLPPLRTPPSSQHKPPR